jgi:hypothetical protein
MMKKRAGQDRIPAEAIEQVFCGSNTAGGI